MPPRKNPKKANPGSKGPSKVASKAATPLAPGTPQEILPPKSLPPVVVGINFGQTASSIALVGKDGAADCIASDDGERQIPSVISFSGAQTYVGNPARLQLVRNYANTVVGFRNLLGKSYDEVKHVEPLYNSAPLVDREGQPAYLIKPPANEEVDGATNERILTVTEITTIYLQTLLKYAEDFIGRKVDAAVLSTPEWFTHRQTGALRSVVEDKLGVKVLQFIDEAGATAVTSQVARGRNSTRCDSNVLVLDIGGSSTTATLLSCRHGLFMSLGRCHDSALGGNDFEDQLMDYFVKEFNKKNKTNLTLLDEKNHKSAIKLRLATEIAKKTLSASNSANCSVDSLYDGYDFSGSINRMRCDLLLSKLYSRIMRIVTDAIAQSGLEKEQLDEVILTGGSTKLAAIAEKLVFTLHPGVKVLSHVEPDEAVAMGCALQADSILKRYSLDPVRLQNDFEPSLSPSCLRVQGLSQPLGLMLPAGDLASAEAVNGRRFVTLLEAFTPLPVKKTFILPPCNPGLAASIPFDLWQGQGLTVVEEREPQTNGRASAEEEEEEDEEEPGRKHVIKPQHAVAHVDLCGLKGGESVKIVIKIENGKGTFLVSSRSEPGGNEVHAEFAIDA